MYRMIRTIARTHGKTPRAVRFVLRLAATLLVGAFVLFPAVMTIPRHPPLLPRSAASHTALSRSCIEGTCQEAARYIRAIVKHVLLRLPAPPLLALALLLAVLPLAIPLCARARPRDWWWPPGRRRALLQVFLI